MLAKCIYLFNYNNYIYLINTKDKRNCLDSTSQVWTLFFQQKVEKSTELRLYLYSCFIQNVFIEESEYKTENGIENCARNEGRKGCESTASRLWKKNLFRLLFLIIGITYVPVKI